MNNPMTMTLEKIQQPNGSLNTIGQGYPHNCEEATRNNT